MTRRPDAARRTYHGSYASAAGGRGTDAPSSGLCCTVAAPYGPHAPGRNRPSRLRTLDAYDDAVARGVRSKESWISKRGFDSFRLALRHHTHMPYHTSHTHVHEGITNLIHVLHSTPSRNHSQHTNTQTSDSCPDPFTARLHSTPSANHDVNMPSSVIAVEASERYSERYVRRGTLLLLCSKSERCCFMSSLTFLSKR